MVLKAVRAKTEAAWTTTKKILALMSCWGLIFSLATITKLCVAFEYDDGLVFSTPAYKKAFASVPQPFTPQFWSVVNRSCDVEQPKFLSQALAWGFRLCGFKVAIIADRPSTSVSDSGSSCIGSHEIVASFLLIARMPRRSARKYANAYSSREKLSGIGKMVRMSFFSCDRRLLA